MSNSLISFQDVSFAYDENPIILDATFQILENQYIAIIGPNGGGKTTALKLMMGFLKPQKGSITTFNRSPEESTTRIGYVPQIMHFDKKFPISVMEVLLMGAAHTWSWWGKIPEKTRQRARESLATVGLEGFEDRPFASLSGGQAQRALFARALTGQPDLLLLDEPTANVDREAEEAILKILNELKGSKTICIVSHDFDAVIHNVDQVICFQKHVDTLSPDEVCKHFAIGLYHPVHKRGAHD